LRPLGFAVNSADGRLTFGDTEPQVQETFPYTLLLRFIGKKNLGFNQKSNAYRSAVHRLVGRHKRYSRVAGQSAKSVTAKYCATDNQ
jgi:hypothetical protein